MKRSLWTTALLLLAATPYSFAQIVTVSRTSFSANFAGDNLFSQFIGPGVNLSAVGGTDTACDWCQADSFSNTPGTSFIPGTQIFYDLPFGILTVGGQTTYCSGQCYLSAPEILAFQDITFPTNGKNFTVTVPAEMDGVEVTIPLGGQPQAVGLGIPFGELTLSFDFIPPFPGGPPSPYYVLDQATFTTQIPEPGPLSLMAAGLAGLLGVMLMRRKVPAPCNP